MVKFTELQIKLLADFFSNMAVVWFAAAFVGGINMIISLRSVLFGIVCLLTGIILIKEVH